MDSVISDVEYGEITDRPTRIPKGTILQKTGDLKTSVYIVRKGLLRSYSLDEKGKEHIYMFGPEGWIVADNVPSEEPAELFIEALEDSEVVILKKEVDAIEPDPNVIFRRFRVLQQRIIMLMSATALERYQHFCDTYPDIIQRVPQRMVASYLGITPEALSKVKNQAIREE